MKWLKNSLWLLLLGIIALNVIAYNHAYHFTHFKVEAGKKVKPENLSTSQKLKTILWGISNPRPKNHIVPSTDYETIKIQSYVQLEGWLIKKIDHKGIVLLFHGYSGSKSDNLTYSKEFNELGYSTLLVDFMGSGDSQGNQTTIGFKESRDVKEVYEFIKTIYPEDKVILFGSSMGAVAIMKSIDEYKIEADKIILECPFGSMKTTVKKRFEVMNLPSFPFAELLMFYGGIQNGFNAFEHNPVKYALDIDIPCLLLYGQKDNRVSNNEIETIYHNLQGDKILKEFPDSGHENYLAKNKSEWLEAVSQFLD